MKNNIYSNNIYRRELKIIAKSIPTERLYNKSVAVTGATGLIGSLLIDVLQYINETKNACIDIYALGRSLNKLKTRFPNYNSNSLLHLVEYEATSVFPEIDIELLFHCAGNSHPKCFEEDPVGTLINSIKSAEIVLNYIIKHDAIALMISSGEIYGQNKDSCMPMSENYTGSLDLSNYRACYTEGKRAMEALCHSFIHQYNAKVKLVRPCRIFGPTMTECDNKASAQFLKKALKGEDIILKSTGEQLFSYLYGADAVTAIFKVMLDGEIGLAYNVASTEGNIKLLDFARIIANQSKVNLQFEISGEPGGSKVTNALLDNSRLCELGWNHHFYLPIAINNTLSILKQLKDNVNQ